MLDRLLEHAEDEGICILPIVARAIFWPGAWAHLHRVEASFLSGTCVLFKRATVIAATSFTALFENIPPGFAPAGPSIRVGRHHYILGLPVECVDHVTVKDWAFAEGLQDARQSTERRATSSAVREGAESAAAAV